ncbi:MAG TPA: hypothetical protein VGK22_07490 [Candidatus Angelobacter sp.]|jgi:hypothetical protein
MRDNHEGYPEIVSAFERGGLCFGVIRLTLPSDSAAFEFGVDRDGYGSLQRILQTRPFDKLAFLTDIFLLAVTAEKEIPQQLQLAYALNRARIQRSLISNARIRWHQICFGFSL